VAQVVETHSTYSWEVACSIPSGIIGFFIDIILQAALWSTQPLTEMRICRGGKGGQC